MQPVEQQEWAKPFPQTSSRLDAQHLQDRYSFLDSTGMPTLHESNKDLQPVHYGELQSNYFEPDSKDEAVQPLDLDLTVSDAMADSVDGSFAQLAQIHPALRSKAARINAQLAVLCSQRSKGFKRSAHLSTSRAEKVSAWKAALGRSSLEQRLDSLVVSLHPKGSKKTKKHSLKSKLWKGRKAAKAKLAASAAKAKLAATAATLAASAAASLGASSGPLVGHKVRLICPSLPSLSWNREQVVKRHWTASDTVELDPDCKTVFVSQVYCLTGKEILPMGSSFDCRRLTAMQKMVGLTAAGGQVQLLPGGALLESAELQAGIQEILCRSGPASPGSLVSLRLRHGSRCCLHTRQTQLAQTFSFSSRRSWCSWLGPSMGMSRQTMPA